jgi:hypothetical protein
MTHRWTAQFRSSERRLGGAYICKDWELRVTARCLDEDLNASEKAGFDAILGLKIVKAFVKDRASQSTGARQVTPLTCGLRVYRLAYGNDHRGATLHDEVDAVIWLLAYGRHRSGKPGDFFPFCKGLDAEGRLLPTEDDLRADVHRAHQSVRGRSCARGTGRAV